MWICWTREWVCGQTCCPPLCVDNVNISQPLVTFVLFTKIGSINSDEKNVNGHWTIHWGWNSTWLHVKGEGNNLKLISHFLGWMNKHNTMWKVYNLFCISRELSKTWIKSGAKWANKNLVWCLNLAKNSLCLFNITLASIIAINFCLFHDHFICGDVPLLSFASQKYLYSAVLHLYWLFLRLISFFFSSNFACTRNMFSPPHWFVWRLYKLHYH